MNQNFDLSQIENLILAAYQSQDSNERIKATELVTQFSDRSFFAQNLGILNSTTSGIVIGWVCNNVKNMFINHFNTFTPNERFLLFLTSFIHVLNRLVIFRLKNFDF